jgi:hypothetical protein
MRLIFGVAILLSLSVAAQAQMPSPQQQSRPFVPFTVEQSDYAQLQSFLAEQPFKVANPLLQWLDQKEQAAARPAQPTATPAPEPPKP